jgi:hypothetical protein
VAFRDLEESHKTLLSQCAVVAELVDAQR